MKLTRKEFLRLASLTALAAATGCGGAAGIDTEPEPPVPKPPNPLDEYKNYVNLFGDIHVHTNLSDGDESPDYAVRYARDVSKLDFCSLSDHSEHFHRDGWLAVPYYRTIPGKYDDPGQFCVLFGYEWTCIKYGHRNVYSLDNQIPILPSDDPNYEDIENLWDGLSGHDVITIPHHPIIPSHLNWWKYVNPEMERVVEFYSKWGSSLYINNPRAVSIQRAEHGVYEALKQGRHYGLICSTDTHLSRPASRLMECRPGALVHPQPGIAGVWATAHTREAIYDALKNRRCYGTTGTRVNMQFTVNKSVMGSEIQCSASPEIAFKVHSEETIEKITLLKIANLEQQTLRTYYPNSNEAEGTFVDDTFTEDAAYSIQAHLANTDMAFASPIWVEKTHAGAII